MARDKKVKAPREKNVILILVEGESDQKALELPLGALFDELDSRYRLVFAQQYGKKSRYDEDIDDDLDSDENDELDDEEQEDGYFQEGGDITSRHFVTPENIERKITNRFFKPQMEREHIKRSMILKVIHIVDLDGAYLNTDRIINYSSENEWREKVFYNTEEKVIECKCVENIQRRNEAKRENLNYLINLSEIKIETKSIPYSVYYFSSNLDHFLHNDANMPYGKIDSAKGFAYKYVDDPKGFCEFFLNDPDSSKGLSYMDSWEKITTGDTESITRCTNFDVLLREIKNGEFIKIQ